MPEQYSRALDGAAPVVGERVARLEPSERERCTEDLVLTFLVTQRQYDLRQAEQTRRRPLTLAVRGIRAGNGKGEKQGCATTTALEVGGIRGARHRVDPAAQVDPHPLARQPARAARPQARRRPRFRPGRGLLRRADLCPSGWQDHHEGLIGVEDDDQELRQLAKSAEPSRFMSWSLSKLRTRISRP